VIGGVAGLAALVGICLFLICRRKRRREQRENWTGKPELHAESLPGAPRPPEEVDAQPRPPQELEAGYAESCQKGSWWQHHVTDDQQARHRMAEMAANEVPAWEMDVKTQHQEMGVQAGSGAEKNRQ